MALAVMALPTFLIATPARADGVNLTVTSATWTPQIASVQSAPSELVRLTLPNANIKIHVTSTVPGGVHTSYNAGGGVYCTADDDISFTCTTTASPAGDATSIQLSYQPLTIIRALGEKASADYTTTATVVETGETATSQYHVRPKADWQIGYTNIQGLSSTEFEIMTNAANRGPSGGSAVVTVTGFRTRPAKPLPADCKWSGALTVKCAYSGDASQDLTSMEEIPIVAGERGCSYQVTVTGVYPDPKPSNNSMTFHGSGPCGSSSATSTATPTTQPTATHTTGSAGTGSGGTSTPVPSPVAPASSALAMTGTPVASATGDVVAAAQSPVALAAERRTPGGSGPTGLIVGLAGAVLVAAGAGALFWIRRRAADTGIV